MFLHFIQHVVVVQSLSHVQLFVTPWTAAYRVSLSSLSPKICSNSCPLSLDAIHLIQPSHPLSTPSPPAFNLSQNQGLSNDSVPHIRRINFWSFRFSISPFNEYSRLISFRFNWFDLLAVQVDTQESPPACTPLFSLVETVILSSQSLLSTLPCDPNVSVKLDSVP